MHDFAAINWTNVHSYKILSKSQLSTEQIDRWTIASNRNEIILYTVNTRSTIECIIRTLEWYLKCALSKVEIIVQFSESIELIKIYLCDEKPYMLNNNIQ